VLKNVWFVCNVQQGVYLRFMFWKPGRRVSHRCVMRKTVM